MIEILPAGPWKNRGAFEEALRKVPAAPWVQLDVDDGIFAGTTASWVPARGETLPGSSSVEAHLMVKDPLPLAQLLVEAGAERIIFHIESFASPLDAHEALTSIATLGAEAGITLLIDTPIEDIAPLIPSATQIIQVMSIDHVGAQGAAFDERALLRVEEIHRRFPDALISVDGGVTIEHMKELAMRGARRFAVGAAIFKSDTPQEAYEQLVSAVA